MIQEYWLKLYKILCIEKFWKFYYLKISLESNGYSVLNTHFKLLLWEFHRFRKLIVNSSKLFQSKRFFFHREVFFKYIKKFIFVSYYFVFFKFQVQICNWFHNSWIKKCIKWAKKEKNIQNGTSFALLYTRMTENSSV